MRERSALGLVLVMALCCLTVAACHHGSSVGERAAAAGYDGSLTFRIVNHSWLDVTIYVQQGMHRERIGTATATTTTEFHFPLRRLTTADYRLFGDPIGSRQAVTSESLHAQDGDIVTWTLEDDLARSSIDVR